MVCYYCGKEMIWNISYTYDEIFGEGEGVVDNFACTCGAEAQFSLREDEER